MSRWTRRCGDVSVVFGRCDRLDGHPDDHQVWDSAGEEVVGQWRPVPSRFDLTRSVCGECFTERSVTGACMCEQVTA